MPPKQRQPPNVAQGFSPVFRAAFDRTRLFLEDGVLSPPPTTNAERGTGTRNQLLRTQSALS